MFANAEGCLLLKICDYCHQIKHNSCLFLLVTGLANRLCISNDIHTIYKNKCVVYFQSAKVPLKVSVTGAAGQIAYSLLPMLANGDVFGKDQVCI